jgi:OOP family OmpA-OmpF porin
MMSVSPDDADSFSRPYWSLGVGKRWSIGETTRLRVEVRGDRTFGDDDDVIGRSMHQYEALAGLSWVFGNAPAERKDSDGDGVWDDDDRCPDTPKGVIVDSHGCPKDSDGDGVFDGIDQCPDTPKGVPVDAVGCPKDTDGDGVTDDKDKCPGTPKGVEVDENGCPKVAPLFQEEKKELILEGVNFEFNSATLTAASSTTLDQVAASLVAWPDIRVEVGGHTDTVGTHEYNVGLSKRRADSVKAYLVNKGVAADRLETAGYAYDRPVATNDTAEGRAQNRRVELKKL